MPGVRATPGEPQVPEAGAAAQPLLADPENADPENARTESPAAGGQEPESATAGSPARSAATEPRAAQPQTAEPDTSAPPVSAPGSPQTAEPDPSAPPVSAPSPPPPAPPAHPDVAQARRERLLRLGRRSIGPAAFVVLGVLLYTAYLAQARTIPATSESGGQALQAWNMLHGNFLLSGWTMSDVSFYTTELPEYMLVELIHGLNNDTVHVAAALSYTLIVVLGGLLARGRATGREGLIRFFIAAGIMLAPPLTSTALLLGDPDHTGTHVPLLIIFLVLDRAPRKWWTPVLVTILLTWAQVADTLVMYEAAIPIALAGLMRANKRRGPVAGNWFDVSLTVGAAISVVAARHLLTTIRDFGGFTVTSPNVTFTAVRDLPQGLSTDLARMLDVLGAKFFGMHLGSGAAGTLIKLVGVVLVAWAVAAGVRRLYRADTELLVQVLSLGIIILVGAYVLSTKNDENEIVGLLPLGAVLAGRVLTPPVIRNKLVPALAVVLVLYAGMLGSNALRPASYGRGAALGAWLKAHHLAYGLGSFWSSTSTTVASGGRVRVRPVRTFEDRVVTTLWESSGSWYDPRQHDANFVISSRRRICSGVCISLRTARESFGPPAETLNYRGWRILVYNKNLLAQLRTDSWCDEGWPWNTPAAPAAAPCRS